MTEPDSLKSLQIDAASRFNDTLQIVAVSAISISAKQLGVAVEPKPGQLAFRITRPPVQFLLLDEQLRVLVPFKVLIEAIGESDERPALAQIEVDMLVTYQRIGPIPDDAMACLPDFAGVAGSLHAWPYIRQEVQDLSVKLGLPALVLPALPPGAAAHVRVLEIPGKGADAGSA